LGVSPQNGKQYQSNPQKGHLQFIPGFSLFQASFLGGAEVLEPCSGGAFFFISALSCALLLLLIIA